MSESQAAEFFISIYAAGVAVCLVGVGFAHARGWAKEHDLGLNLFMAVIWPLAVFACVISAPIGLAAYALFSLGKFIGRKRSRSEEPTT